MLAISTDFRRKLLGVCLPLLLLAACGHGSDGMAGSGLSTPARGTLLKGPGVPTSTVTAPSLLLELGADSNQQLLSLSGTPICDIAIYHIEYQTVGGADEPTTASAALMVPIGLGADCNGSRPIVLYAHGTSTDRNFDMTNLANAEALSLAALFASQGFVVVAPNYAGYDTSTLAYHPYVIADQQSKDMIDALSAARTALPLASATTTKDSGALFITGYSQGGYVAMATHRAMQAAGMKVTASAPMSGPYALAAFVDAVFYGEVNLDATIAASFLLTAYQDAYQDIYASTADVFEPPYAASIQTLLPSTSPVSTLYSEGKLPPSHLFSAEPPAPEYADITPPTAPADLAEAFALGFGAGNLILNSFRAAYLTDAAAHPDGGFPTVTTGVPAAAPTLAWRQALQKNDLRDWVPSVPVQLCGGEQDPDVFWFNTTLMQRYWAAHAATAPVTVLDLEAAAAAGDPYAALKQDFALAKQVLAADAVIQGATDGGALAVLQAYHATLVAPFCFAAAKRFFSGQ
jgi:alpha/beta superfamily hydrolase